MMKYQELCILFFLSLATLSCGTGSESESLNGVWQNIGLENSEINAIDVTSTHFFVAGATQLFRKGITDVDNAWDSLDLEINTENSVFGDILYTNQGLYAVVKNTTSRHELPEDYTSLYISNNQGETWAPLEIELEERPKPYILLRIEKDKSSESGLYADWNIVFKSMNGKNWTNLSKEVYAGRATFLYVSEDHPEQIWIGGDSNFFHPTLIMSNDGGDTWVNLNEEIGFNTETTTYSVSVSPTSEQVVLASFVGGVGVANKVRKSIDAGETWSSVLEDYGVLVLKNSVGFSNRVYGAGITHSGLLYVAVSANFGDSWEIIEYENGPLGIITNDLVVAEIDGKETLFFGTNKGVYSYTFTE